MGPVEQVALHLLHDFEQSDVKQHRHNFLVAAQQAYEQNGLTVVKPRRSYGPWQRHTTCYCGVDFWPRSPAKGTGSSSLVRPSEYGERGATSSGR